MRLSLERRAKVFVMFGGRCAYCGAQLPEKKWHADHYSPLIRKGSWVRCDEQGRSHKFVTSAECRNPANDQYDNLFPSCIPCNIDKSTYEIEEWRQLLERRPASLRANSSAWRHAERFGLVRQVSTTVTFYFESCIKAKEVSA
jgi:5-methylcytosine-specific restriction endonuclease McrA